MKRAISILSAAILVAWIAGCAQGPETAEKLEVSMAPAKGYTGEVKGTCVIDAQTGTGIRIDAAGLDPQQLYTVFFVNPKSYMFEGIGAPPHILSVDAGGQAHFEGTIKKDIYKKFTKVAVYQNPGNVPIENPVGVKAALGSLIKTELPTMVLEGSLR